jgi:hypothetical protein
LVRDNSLEWSYFEIIAITDDRYLKQYLHRPFVSAISLSDTIWTGKIRVMSRFHKFLKWYLHRRENNKYLSLAMAILKRWEIFY